MRRPAFNPQVQAVVDAVHLPSITPELVEGLRAQNAGDPDALVQEGLERTDHEVPGWRGEPITVSTWRRPGAGTDGPCFLSLHGGGMISGDRWACDDALVDLLDGGGVLASVEYRLAPEHPAPTQVEDCWAALTWLVEHAGELGFDPGRVVLAGTSAGGGLAAGVLLLARERGGPVVLGAWLNTPMLDDTTSTCSASQFMRDGLFWDGRSNITAWQAVLGPRFGTDEVAPHEAPARATSLADLPPMLVTVGAAEAFRDEAVAFASAVWRDGGECQLLVLPGGMHCFADAVPGASISRTQRRVVEDWLHALLHPDDPADAAADIERLKPNEEHFRR